MQYLIRFRALIALLREGDAQFIRRIENRFGFIINFGLLFALPAILPFIRRAAPVSLGLAGVCGVLMLICSNRMSSRVRSWFSNLYFNIFCLFTLWCLATSFWSTWAFRGITQLFLCALMVIFGCLLYSTPREAKYRLYLTVGVLVGGAFILIDLSTGLNIIKIYSSRPEAYRYNMALVTLLLLPWGLLDFNIKGFRFLRVMALSVLTAAIFVSESETAKVALMLGAVAYVFGLFLSRTAIQILVFASLLSVWMVSMFATDVFNVVHQLFPVLWSEGHANERLQIWHAFGQMGLAGQPWGWGIGTIAAPQFTSFYEAASPEIRSGLGWWHSHNNFLQIWVELGVPGVFLAFVLSALLILPKMPEVATERASFCAFLAAVHFVAMVSPGLWQTWWWAAVMIGAYAQVVTRSAGIVVESQGRGNDQ